MQVDDTRQMPGQWFLTDDEAKFWKKERNKSYLAYFYRISNHKILNLIYTDKSIRKSSLRGVLEFSYREVSSIVIEKICNRDRDNRNKFSNILLQYFLISSKYTLVINILQFLYIFPNLLQIFINKITIRFSANDIAKYFVQYT